MKITKRQLRRIIKEEKARLDEGIMNYSRGPGFSSKSEELLSLATYADRALTYFEEQVAQFDSVSEDNELAEMIADVAYSLQVIARNARNKAKDL